eukprot:TRINITY_DN8272_c0_g1_i1.p1 TRINITY_DN8272_c0_g1~~TRINITY_DN8272_c0_g1_i1.p1  ORF type:complete len:305 (+),score=56.51 TRINITY_DN8272_c0_g1_i1:678-1592(+)
MGSKDETIELSIDTFYCRLCSVSGSTDGKALKQHLKSKGHKDAINGKAPKKVTKRVREQIKWSEVIGWEGGEFAEPTVAMGGEKKLFQEGRPFLTYSQSGTLSIDNPQSLEELIHFCCTPDKRFPNVDISGENLCIETWSQAKKAILSAESGPSPKVFWVSFQADGLVDDPNWWPKGNAVPTYTNVIVASKNAGIGIHLDVDNVGPKKVNIHSYLTLSHGSKHVIALPPNHGIDLTIFNDQFPDISDAHAVSVIREAGGVFFPWQPVPTDLGELPCTLYIPKGWYHWLVSTSDSYSVAFGSSSY